MNATELLQIIIGFVNEREKRWIDQAVVYADPSIYTENPSTTIEAIRNEQFIARGLRYFNMVKDSYDRHSHNSIEK
jgi:hypothetical protein